MPFLALAALSLLVGALVYAVTVYAEQGRTTAGFGDAVASEGAAAEPPAPPGRGYAYLRVSTEGPSVRERLLGLVGLVLLVVVSAAALAFTIYEAGHLINRTIQSFLGP
jgi:hypothetical protein